MNIALITPKNKQDYMADTVLDGLMQLREANPNNGGSIVCKVSPYCNSRLPVSDWKMPHDRFIEFARAADLIMLFSGKGNTTDYDMAEEIGRWDKTVFIDGSEPGKNNRLDPDIMKKIADGTYEGEGRVDLRMLEKCVLYFRRERPYRIPGIGKETIPLPFGIESKYVAYLPGMKKDIDFVCVFGQEDYPPLRKQVRLALEEFCKKNSFSCRTGQTRGLFSDIYSEPARRRFYKTLARAKVGISVSGGGFDTVRFWEILANGCLVLTEKIDIYEEGSKALDYKCITQFNDFNDFGEKLEKVAAFLKDGYDSVDTRNDMAEEYGKIMVMHSSKARVMMILETAKKAITRNPLGN
jgi:hypothetical protein